jgi:ArsR family transcriptional regulator
LTGAAGWSYACIIVQIRKRRPRTPLEAARLSRPIDGLLDAEVFRALSDPTRLRMLACLAKCGRPCGVSEVAECCSVDLSVVSRHLSALADAGVLESAKEGRTVSYRVKFAEMAGMFRSLADALEDCCPEECGGGSCGPGCC